MPRSISSLVVLLMRVANVGGGGGLQAEVTSELSLRSSKTCCFLSSLESRLSGACWRGSKQVDVLAYVG